MSDEPKAESRTVDSVVRCHKLSQVTTDAKVEAEFPNLFRYAWRKLTPEDKARELENACAEFAEFIRDHRSQDPVRLDVVRVKEDLCSHCERPWETMEEEGKTLCAWCGAEVDTANDRLEPEPASGDSLRADVGGEVTP